MTTATEMAAALALEKATVTEMGGVTEAPVARATGMAGVMAMDVAMATALITLAATRMLLVSGAVVQQALAGMTFLALAWAALLVRGLQILQAMAVALVMTVAMNIANGATMMTSTNNQIGYILSYSYGTGYGSTTHDGYGDNSGHGSGDGEGFGDFDTTGYGYGDGFSTGSPLDKEIGHCSGYGYGAGISHGSEKFFGFS